MRFAFIVSDDVCMIRRQMRGDLKLDKETLQPGYGINDAHDKGAIQEALCVGFVVFENRR